MRVIELDPADTFASARDRLLRGGRGRTVLVLSPRGEALRRGVDLALLRRLADRERLEIGLVTADRDVARQARALGLPAFASVTLAEHYRPGWWRGRRRAERVGFAPEDDRRSPEQIALEHAADSEARRGDRLWLAVLLVAGVLALALLAAAAVYALPGATVTLRPATLPVQAIAELNAGPISSDANAGAVPARPVHLPVTWEAVGENTGEAAQASMRALALQGLSTAAPDMLTARLAPGYLLIPSAVHVAVDDEQFAPQGEATRLTLRGEVNGLAVATADVVEAVYGELAAALPPGFTLDPATVRLELSGPAGSSDGRFVVTARATGSAALDGVALANALAGQPLTSARAYLDALPLAEPAALDVQPAWWARRFARLPLRPARIQVEATP